MVLADDGAALPESTGWQFWSALFVGDAEAMAGAVAPDDFPLLISPEDPIANVDLVLDVYRNVLELYPNQPDQLCYAPEWSVCSYTGPAKGLVTRAHWADDLANRAIGTTGARGGICNIVYGINVLWGDGSVSFISFHDAARDESWGTAAPWQDLHNGYPFDGFLKRTDCPYLADIDRVNVPD